MKIKIKKGGWMTLVLIYLLLQLPNALVAQRTIFPDEIEIMKELNTKIAQIAKFHDSTYMSSIYVKNRNGQAIDYNLPFAKNKKLSASKIYEKNRGSVLRVQYSYKCGNCNDIHFVNNATAFVLTEDGLAVTNYHVLKSIILNQNNSGLSSGISDMKIFFTTEDNRVYFLKEVLTYDATNDIALFTLDLLGDKLVPVTLGKDAKVGENVYVISHPNGISYFFSNGIVALNHKVPLNNDMDTIGLRMNITADYAKGSSGGPIFDDYGNVVGIVSSTSTIAYNDDQSKPLEVQMVIKSAVPVVAIKSLINKK